MKAIRTVIAFGITYVLMRVLGTYLFDGSVSSAPQWYYAVSLVVSVVTAVTVLRHGKKAKPAETDSANHNNDTSADISQGSHYTDSKTNMTNKTLENYDELLPQAVEVLLDTKQASVSMLQRRLKLGYSRAARLVDQMEELGIVGPFEGSKPRQLLITRKQWQEYLNVSSSGGGLSRIPSYATDISKGVDYESIIRDEENWRREQLGLPPVNDKASSSVQSKKAYSSANKRFLSDEETAFLSDCVTQMTKLVDQLLPYDQIDISPPAAGDRIVYLPVEGTYNSRFFTRMFLLREHQVANEIVSAFDMVQYQIPVKTTNTELILLVYGLHVLESIRSPESQINPIGCSLCDETIDVVKQECPVLSLVLKVWEFRDAVPERRGAVLRSEQFRAMGEQDRRLIKWINDNFKLASADYHRSSLDKVKWVQEYKLYSLINFWYDDAIYQYSPTWLAGQSIDIFIPSLKMGFEYQGEQHYTAVDFFGGEEKLLENQQRDKTKSELCKDNGVTVISWPYTRKVTFSAVQEYLNKSTQDVKLQLLSFSAVSVDDILSKADTYAQMRNKEAQKQREERHPVSIIRAYDNSGELIGEYTTITDASADVDVSTTSIQKCLTGQNKTAAGLIWRREPWGSSPLQKEEVQSLIASYPPSTAQTNTGKSKRVIQIDPSSGEIIKIHSSITAAAKAVGVNSKGIQDVIKKKQNTAGGYYWQLYE